ncbi:MAG: hypothetical protein RLZZ214_3953, partial [Verrucomicrobiota bacterium]
KGRPRLIQKSGCHGVSESRSMFKFGHRGGHDPLRCHYIPRLTKIDAIG